MRLLKKLLDFILQLPSGEQVGKSLDTTFVQFYHPMYRISSRVLYSHFKETMIGLGYGK